MRASSGAGGGVSESLGSAGSLNFLSGLVDGAVLHAQPHDVALVLVAEVGRLDHVDEAVAVAVAVAVGIRVSVSVATGEAVAVAVTVAEAAAGRIEGDAVQTVGAHEGLRGGQLHLIELALDLQRHVVERCRYRQRSLLCDDG